MPAADPLEQVRATFRDEGSDLLQQLETHLLHLEVAGEERRDELVREALRVAHTLKGAASSLEYSGAAGIIHGLETVLQRPDRLARQADAFDAIHGALDALRANLEVIGTSAEAGRVVEALAALAASKAMERAEESSKGTRPAAEPANPVRRRQDAADVSDESAVAPAGRERRAEQESVRIRLQAVRELMSLSGEVAIRSHGAKERIGELRAQLQRLGVLLESLTPGGAGSPLNGVHRGLLLALDRLEFEALHDALQADALHGAVRSLGLRPLSEVFRPLPRLARDLGRALGKELDVTLEGESPGIERSLLDPLRDSLAHLVRNSVDHGLETPQERLRAGKPRSGRLHVAASLQGSVLSVEVSDDGRGIDVEQVKRRAVQAGLVDSAAAARMSEQAAADLVFRPGLSTKDEVSQISGRGVGLDSVRSAIERSGGTVHVASTPGQGTLFTLSLPVLSHRSHSLILRVGGERVAIPSTAVQRVTRVGPQSLANCDGQLSMDAEGIAIPVIELAVLLGAAASPGAIPTHASLVVLRSQERLAAFLVDELLFDEEVLVRDLEPPLQCPRLLAGVAVRQNGELICILNPIELLRAAGHRAVFARDVPAAPAVARARRLLVVDDSFTIRTLQKSLLEMAGYDVLVAADGDQALALLEREEVDGILSDVSMPNRDGFDLLDAVRQSPRLRELPFILVTSRSSDADRMRGLRLGASAYVVKSELERDTLLQIVSNHIG
ncbi:MAG: hybrid sensor histidine kinase/response regulator [Myxococcales bacterium]